MRGRGKKIAAVIALLAVVLIAAVGAFTYFGKDREININDYIKVYVEGTDGYGTAFYSFDDAKFSKDYGKELDNKKKLKKYSYVDAADMISEVCVELSLDKEEYLSNGDVITLAIKCNNELAKDVFGYTLKCSDIEYTVSELPETGTVDAFENIAVKFSGTEPDGTAEIEYGNLTGKISLSAYLLDKETGLSNGDVVTVILNDPDDPELISLLGGIPETISKQFIVEGLTGYAMSFDDIPESVQNKMIEKGMNKLKTELLSDDDKISFVSADYVGNYFFTQKEYSDYYKKNIIDMVYMVTVNIDNESENVHKTEVCYVPVEFANVMIDSNGKDNIDYDELDLPLTIKAVYDYHKENSQYTMYTIFGASNDIAGVFDKLVGGNFEIYEYADNIQQSTDADVLNDYYISMDSNRDDVYANLYFAGYNEEEKTNNMNAFEEKYNMEDVSFEKVEDVYDGEWYAVIPKYKDTRIEIYHVEPDDKGNLRETKLIAATQSPALICCNPSDIMPSVRVKITYRDKTVEFEPGISLEDGSVLNFNGIQVID